MREVVASDLTPEMLIAAQAFIRGAGASNITFREADACALPFEDASFDLVTCRTAAHHFADCARFVREAARVLTPGGVAAVVDNVTPEDSEAVRFINDFELLRDPSHQWAYPASAWSGLFEAAGLVILHHELFRKARDFERWTDVVASPDVKARLTAMLLGATGDARETLAPEEHEGRLRLYLTEILILGRRTKA